MYWTNMMKVTLKDAETAVAALEIMKARLTEGFDSDEGYEEICSKTMRDNMEVVDNIIALPEEFRGYRPEDSMIVIPELMQYLAEQLREETFTFITCHSSDCDESWVDGSYANGELKLKAVFFGYGFTHIFCDGCDEEVAYIEDNADGNVWIVSTNDEIIANEEDLETGKTYICPECGEEIDLSEWVVINTKTMKII